MGTICPKCGKLNDEEKDETCPHCGVLYAKARQAQKQQSQKNVQREGEFEEVSELWAFLVRHPVLGVSMVLAILAGGIAVFSYESGSHVADQRAMTGEAERACENHIRSVAQRPSTVRFHVSGLQAQMQDSGSVVTNHVFSAENMLGVRIRSRARCTVGSDGRVQSFSSVRQ